MSDAPSKKLPILGILALAVLAGIPLSRLWLKDHGNRAFDLIKDAKKAEQEIILPLGKGELSCQDAEIRHIGGEIWVAGCGKRARYVLDGERWRREGDVERDESTTDNCRVRWKSDDDAGVAKSVAIRVREQGQTARTRIPLTKFDVPGFKKLRYPENVDAYFRIKDPLPDQIPVPCIDPEADGGYRQGTCDRPWSDVVEVDACDE